MMASLVERLMGSIDLEAITKDVMSKLVIADLELYFVIQQFPDSDEHTLIGMTYGKESALDLKRDKGKKWPTRVIKLNMGKLLKLIEDMGAIEEVV